MSENVTKLQLDKAYNYLIKGEIVRAAVCFQHIIDNPEIYDPMGWGIARRGMIWYCIPLDLIFREMDKTKSPVNIWLLFEELFKSDKQYDSIEFNKLVNTIENELVKSVNCTKIGTNIWILKRDLEKQVKTLSNDVNERKNPIVLDEFFMVAWKDFFVRNPDFPDEKTKANLAAQIQSKSLIVLDQTLILPNDYKTITYHAYIQAINQAKKPLSFKKFLLDTLEKSIGKKYFNPIRKYLKINYESNIINYSKDYYLTKSLINLDRGIEKLKKQVNNNQNPFSTDDIIQNIITIDEDIPPSEKFCEYVRSELRQNSQLIESQDDIWFSKAIYNDHYSKIIENLKKTEALFSIKTLIESSIGWGAENVHFDNYSDLLLTKILDSKLLINMTEDEYIFINRVNYLIQDIYDHLIAEGSKSIKEISQILFCKLTDKPVLETFLQKIKQQLSYDNRFVNVSYDNAHWRAIQPWEKEHDKIIAHLDGKTRLFSLEEAMKIPGIDKNFVDLAKDDRFKLFPDGCWGLSKWVLINDFAYDYLSRTKNRLHENNLIHNICEEKELAKDSIIFLPAVDDRFIQDNYNRWYCKHFLTEEEVNRILKELIHYGGSGRRLNQLLNDILHLDPTATNAEEVFENDPRFAKLDDIWFSRETVFIELNENDLDGLFDELSKAKLVHPIPIKALGENYFGRDGRLTNLSELLSLDDRFKEIHPEYWILSTWQPENFSREWINRNPAVSKAINDSVTPTGQVVIPKILTRRGQNQDEDDTERKLNNKIYITLGHLDIYHGNIRINEKLDSWIPSEAITVRLIDPHGFEIIGFIDVTRRILSIKEYIHKRSLTYGDKIFMQRGNEQGSIIISQYGQRNQRVYQEALNHKNLERLIEEARRVNKSYHDLMVEVMEDMGIPLHREDIYQLVDYQRTASRNTISQILSLRECPYEELRYFVNRGNGMWLFDRRRKDAFDMKMNELEEENILLRTKIKELTEKDEVLAKLNQTIIQLEHKNKELEQGNNEIKQQLEKIKIEFESKKHSADGLNTELQSKVYQLERENGKLLLAKNQLNQIVDSLQKEYLKQKSIIEGNLNGNPQEKINSEEENKALKEEISTLEEDIDDLRNSNSILLTELDVKESERAALIGNEKRYKEIIEDQKDIIALNIEKNEDLKKEIAYQHDKLLTLEDEVEKIQKANDSKQVQRLGELDKYKEVEKRLIRIEEAFDSAIGRFILKIMGIKEIY